MPNETREAYDQERNPVEPAAEAQEGAVTAETPAEAEAEVVSPAVKRVDQEVEEARRRATGERPTESIAA